MIARLHKKCKREAEARAPKTCDTHGQYGVETEMRSCWGQGDRHPARINEGKEHGRNTGRRSVMKRLGWSVGKIGAEGMGCWHGCASQQDGQPVHVYGFSHRRARQRAAGVLVLGGFRYFIDTKQILARQTVTEQGWHPPLRSLPSPAPAALSLRSPPALTRDRA